MTCQVTVKATGMADVPCNQNSVQDVTAISCLYSVCVAPIEL